MARTPRQSVDDHLIGFGLEMRGWYTAQLRRSSKDIAVVVDIEGKVTVKSERRVRSRQILNSLLEEYNRSK